MKNKMFVIGALVVGVLVFTVLLLRNKEEKPQSQTAENPPKSQEQVATNAELFVRPHSPRFGNSMARVTVVEWLDPECEACRAMHPIVKKVIKDYEGRVFFVIRYMPYHPGSEYAASVLEEARELGKFDEALNILFEKQPEWGNHHQPRPELIPGYLSKLGIPSENLQKEKVIAKHTHKIRQDKDDGEKVGVKGTPSFFVNQKPLQGLGDSALRSAIESELAANN